MGGSWAMVRNLAQLGLISRGTFVVVQERMAVMYPATRRTRESFGDRCDAK